MVVVCGDLLQPRHLLCPATVCTGLRYEILASQDPDTGTMIACGIADYGLVQVDATEYLHVTCLCR